MLPEKTYFESLGYYLTDNGSEADHDQHYSPEIEAKKQEALVECQKAKPRYLPKLLELVKKYPQVPAFRNYLSVYYQFRKKDDKAFKVNQQLVKEFPDYIHSRTNLASFYIAKKQYEKVPELLGETLELQDLFLDRKVFHLSEFEGYMNVSCQYLLATGQLDEAQKQLDLLEEILPDSVNIPYFRADLIRQRLTKNLEQIEARQIRREGKQIDRGYDRSIQTEDMPQFQHPEMLVLYEKDLHIPHEELKKILALPRAGLITDLTEVLWDSVRRHEYFQTKAETDELDNQTSFPLHALFLLTELKAYDQLPLLRDCLRQGEEYLDFWYGDHLYETWWQFIYILGQDQLELLKQFMIEPNIYYTGKVAVSESVKEIGLHQPERLPEVLDWFESILLYYLEHLDSPKLVDPDLTAPIFADLSRLPGAERLLPLISKFYDLDLVDLFNVGKFDALKEMILNPKRAELKRQLHADIFEHYSHILTTWAGYQTDDGQWAARQAELEQKRKVRQSEQTPAIHRPKENMVYSRSGSAVSTKVGRNDPCPCGSGKKHKKCCWGK